MSNFLGSVQPTGGLEIFQPKGKRISRATHVSPTEQIEICLLVLQ